MKVSVLPDGPCPPATLCSTDAQTRGRTYLHTHRDTRHSPEPMCTPLCSPGSSHFSPLPTSLNPSPTAPSPSSLLTLRFNLSASPGCSRLLLSVDLALLKGRQRQRGKQKGRGKQKKKPPKGQWCPEPSHCITMSMDSIKLRSAC